MRPELQQASVLLRQSTPESIEEAIHLLQDTVFSFSMRVCGHREDAEDTMQDVLFGSLKYFRKLDTPNALAAWLYTVTRNRCRHMRRMRPESSARHLPVEDLLVDQHELPQLTLAANRSPEAQILRIEQIELLHGCVLKLPTSLRLVLVLHDLEELSAGEVGRILNLQAGTVRVRLHRARLALRKEMERSLRGLSAGEKASTERCLIRNPFESLQPDLRASQLNDALRTLHS